ncbi:MAG: ABC transporter permease subunit, partial [Campylobacter sp.]|nr:ABC transporter permease subunit [Campylobacter sp.]
MNEKVLKVLVFIVIICVGLYFTYPENLNDARKMAYVKAYGTTLTLTLGGVLIGIILGFILAFIKFLGIKPLNFIIDEYIDIIRGTPIVIQLMIFVFVIFATWQNNVIAAIFALGLNSSAYVAEIVRSGINSVDNGQMEAARAMGLDYKTSMKEIVFPQAIKNILP